MSLPVVLDAEGLDALCERRPPERLRAVLGEAWRRQRDVVVPALVCAEVCRGVSRTRAVESTLARHPRRRGERPVEVVPTDFALARRVGAILHKAGAGSSDVVDAHVVAICVGHGGGMVISSDSSDIVRLAQAAPSVRMVVRPAR